MQDFHARYYHPSNARIWFYGDDDPEERLRILSTYLDNFDARQVTGCSITPLAGMQASRGLPAQHPPWAAPRHPRLCAVRIERQIARRHAT